MVLGNTELADAVAAAATTALEGQAPEEGAEGTAGKAEATEPAKEAAPASTEVGSEVTTDVPQTLFGVDLSALPDDEARATFVREWTETNKTIGKLQREKAEALAAQQPAPQAPAPEPVVDVSSLTDEQIASAIGINLEESVDLERDQREVNLTRTLLEQQERLEKMETGFTSTQESARWTAALSDLTTRFGDLPEDTTAQDVIAYARDNGIASPEAAYWAAVGPIRTGVAQALEKKVADLRTSGKKGASTVRPTGSAKVDEAKLASTNVRDAVKEAFEKARARLGVEYVPSE